MHNIAKMYFLLYAFLSVIYCVSSEKVISIENGNISGEEREDFFAFRGLPYAESPVGDLRLAPPKRYAQKWDGVRKFENYSDVCAQYDHLDYAYTGVEDCLTLNVFVPKSVLRNVERVPVIFFIHGGAFMFGSGTVYLPENIMKAQNMILVTVNYRLGILGFLSTEDKTIPGNFGLKDQVEALKWVQRNIGSFNGDPEKVTIVGYSAGGASVHLHYMSPLSDGLFQNGISHSGVAINPWVMMENAKQKTHKVASFAKCPHDDHEKMLKCLREKPAEELVLYAAKFQPFLYNPFSPFGVVMEPRGESAFLTDDPLKILEEGKFKRLPWLLSQTQDEGLYPAAEFYDDEILKTINNKWNVLAPFILDFNEVSTIANRKSQISLKIRHFYLGYENISKKSFAVFDDILSDRLFKHGAHKAIQLQTRFSTSYFYYFRYKSLSGLAEYMSKSKDNIGVSHGEDVLLIYGHTLRDFPYSDEEAAVGQKLINLYYNFAKFNLPVYDNIKIEETKPDMVKYLEISKTAEMKDVEEDFGKPVFWDDVDKILSSEEGTFYDEVPGGHEEL